VLVFAALLAMSLVPSARGAPVRSFYELAVVVAEDFPDYAFTFDLDSPFNGTNPLTEAWTITISVVASPELEIAGVAGGTWNEAAYHVNGDHETSNLTARVTANTTAAMDADLTRTFYATLDVTVVYTDNEDARPRTIRRTFTFALNYLAPPRDPGLLPAAAIGLGGAGAFGIALFAVKRARIEELYLMHDSGLLIRHWSRTNGMAHDSDIMSGMFIVLQEFIRDSFSDRQGSLEHLRFGKRQVVMARGRHTILAAVVRGRYLNGLPGKLQQAIDGFEGSYRDILPTWNGNVGMFPRVDELADRVFPGRRRGAAA